MMTSVMASSMFTFLNSQSLTVVRNRVIHLSWDSSGPRGLVQKNLYLSAVTFFLDVRCLFNTVRATS